MSGTATSDGSVRASDALTDVLAAGPGAIDGGLASELESRGYDLTGTLWSARVLRDDPAAIQTVHETYFASGARVGIAASYQASRSGFAAHGLDARQADDLLALSVDLVRQARDRVRAAGAGHPMLVAASVGPYGATLHDGSEYRGRYGRSQQFLVEFHRERAEVLAAAGPDLFAVETVPDVDEVVAVGEAIRGLGIPAWLSLSCADDAHTCAGQPVEEAAAAVVGAGVFGAVGVNCTKPEYVGGLVRRLRASAPALPVVVYPNAGRVWDGDASVWLGNADGSLPQQAIEEWFAAGATLIGGCCGLGPDTVAQVASLARVAAGEG